MVCFLFSKHKECLPTMILASSFLIQSKKEKKRLLLLQQALSELEDEGKKDKSCIGKDRKPDVKGECHRNKSMNGFREAPGIEPLSAVYPHVTTSAEPIASSLKKYVQALFMEEKPGVDVLEGIKSLIAWPEYSISITSMILG